MTFSRQTGHHDNLDRLANATVQYYYDPLCEMADNTHRVGRTVRVGKAGH